MDPTSNPPCGSCAQPSSFICARCQNAWYCGESCQRASWRAHKPRCSPARQASHSSGGVRGAAAAGALRADSNAAWLVGFAPPDCYEWLTNCYQMRCDDDYAYGGGNLHGPYDPDATAYSISCDFLAFCVLAARRGVVPRAWPWADFLKVAAQFAPFAFENSDAQERWGSENVITVLSGGRSLRFTAEKVYGSGAMQQTLTPEHSAVLDAVGVPETARGVRALPAALLAEAGGVEVWERFSAAVTHSRQGR